MGHCYFLSPRASNPQRTPHVSEKVAPGSSNAVMLPMSWTKTCRQTSKYCNKTRGLQHVPSTPKRLRLQHRQRRSPSNTSRRPRSSTSHPGTGRKTAVRRRDRFLPAGGTSPSTRRRSRFRRRRTTGMSCPACKTAVPPSSHQSLRNLDRCYYCRRRLMRPIAEAVACWNARHTALAAPARCLAPQKSHAVPVLFGHCRCPSHRRAVMLLGRFSKGMEVKGVVPRKAGQKRLLPPPAAPVKGKGVLQRYADSRPRRRAVWRPDRL